SKFHKRYLAIACNHLKHICLCYFTALNLDQSADDGSNQCLRLVNHHKKRQPFLQQLPSFII
ncbi:TPA: hypothetical protein ACQMYU_001915, partial [Streptococcus pyogenes]